MFSVIGNFARKFSLLRRLIFASTHLPEELPRFWEQVAWFANLGLSPQSSEEVTVSSQDAQLCMDNLMELDPEVFKNDNTMFFELCQSSTDANNPLGCVLISKNSTCRVCGATLLLKKRESVRKVVVYDLESGTHIGCHYIKFYRNRTCQFRQYYDKHTTNGMNLYYDPDWMDNDFLLSTHQTAFKMHFLKSYDVELLVGQISYNQKASIYNAIHGYDRNVKKSRNFENMTTEPELEVFTAGSDTTDKRYDK